SPIAGGMASGRLSRSAAGMLANSSSIDETPIRASIAFRSAGVFRTYAKASPLPRSGSMTLVGQLLVVLGGRHQVVEGGARGQVDLSHAAAAERVVVDRRQIRLALARLGLDQHLVPVDDRAGDRGIEVGGGLDRFDDAERLLRGERLADGGQLQERRLGQLLDGELRDADG